MLNDFYFNNTNIVGKINVIGIDVIVSINNFLTQYQLHVHVYRSPLVPLRKILYLAAPDNYLGAATYYLPDAI